VIPYASLPSNQYAPYSVKLEGEALGANSSDPLSGSLGILPEHRSSAPTPALALSETSSEGGSVQETGSSVNRRSGLAKDEFTEGNSGELIDLEDRGVREVGLGGGEERVAVLVIAALVVVLDVPPVDRVTDGLGDGVISSMGIDVGIIGEPRAKGCMSYDEFFKVTIYQH
jgi:hypothetical protein